MITLPEKIYRSQSTNQFAKLNERLPDLCFAICRFSQVQARTPHRFDGSIEPPFVDQVEFFFLLSLPMPWSKFPRHGNDQCDSQNKPRQGSTWGGYGPRNDAGHSLPETENLAFLSSSTLTGRSSMRSVSLFRSVP